jgi:capsular polysaccharide export protein
VLVAGQVEDDRSVRLGGAGIRGALDLLARVRAAEPDAYILFKPHPDVEAGHRPGAVTDATALRFADGIVRDRTLPDLLASVDAVHVLTSLCGFEALLRGREVVVHGQPFYAGWGLTRDLAPPPRRGRPLSLAELVAGALILYPHYRDPRTGLPCSPEILVSRLAEGVAPPSALTQARQAQGRIGAWARSLRPPSHARTPESSA